MPSDESTRPSYHPFGDSVAKDAAQKLTGETRHDIVSWVLRAGLGPMYLQQSQRQLTADEVEALMSIKFDAMRDPLHHDLASTIDTWWARCDPQ